MRFLPGWLRGGSNELGWDDLVRRVVKAIARLSHYGSRGSVAFPPDVTVRIEVAEGSLEVIRRFVAKAEFDATVASGLANECDCDASRLPLREYVVVGAERTDVTARESTPRGWTLRIEGGDLAGSVVTLPPSRTESRFGRGAYHGSDRHLRNDVVVSESNEHVSRRAGRLFHTGARLEVESLDQGDSLAVRRLDGELVRPARTAKGRVAVADGDAIELPDGRGGVVRLVIARAPTNEGNEGRGGDHT